MKKIRDAQTIVGLLEGGEFAADLGNAITDSLAKLKEMAGNRPKAKVKGKVKVAFHLTVEQGTVTIETDIVPELPKKPRGSSFYWVTDDGSLSPEHPQQTDMFAGPRELSARA
ncbi:hypothetical protein ACXIUS_01635 [Bosea thiooxidans]